MEGKTNFSMRPKQFDDVTDPDPHILLQIYATKFSRNSYALETVLWGIIAFLCQTSMIIN